MPSKSPTATLPESILIRQHPQQHPVSVHYADALQATHKLMKRNNHVVAAYMLRQMADQAPRSYEPLWQLLVLCRNAMRLDEAEDAVLELLERFPAENAPRIDIARFYHVAGRPAEAMSHLDHILVEEPENLEVLHMKIAIHQALGDWQGVEDCLARCLLLAPENPNILLAAARHYKSGALPELQERIFRITTSMQYEGELQARLHYAMAWLQAENPDRQFEHLKPANDIMARLFVWDRASTEFVAQRNRRLFSDPVVTSLRHTSNETFAPIFIAAMPRSGTTLLEQMLGAHENVHAVGERAPFDIALTSTLFLNNPLLSAENLGDISDPHGALAEIAHAYRSTRQIRAAGDKRVVDKAIGNWNVLGLICLAFPEARVIRLRRHPLDVIYSCYQQFFDTGHFYANNLTWLARMYRIFESQMAFWGEVFPENIISIRYEDLVRDQKGELDKVLRFCGLTWSDRCMNFQRAMGAVTTASDHQVRRPLYTDSSGRWRAAESQLGEAIAGLGDFVY